MKVGFSYLCFRNDEFYRSKNLQIFKKLNYKLKTLCIIVLIIVEKVKNMDPSQSAGLYKQFPANQSGVMN